MRPLSKKSAIVEFLEKRIVRVLFCIGFLAWFLPLSPWFIGKAPFISDASVYYRMTQSYIVSMSEGTYPLWDPFNVWGRPEGLSLRWIGEFHPLLFDLLLLVKCGVPFKIAYAIYMFLCEATAFVIYYFLLREISRDKLASLFGMFLLMFSIFSYKIVFDPGDIFLLSSMFLFFLFLFRFHRTFAVYDFWGLILAVMIIMITYLPFYTITVAWFFILGYLVVFPDTLLKILRGYGMFLRKFWPHFILGLVCVLCSAVPGWRWFDMAGGGNFFVGWRHYASQDPNMATMAYRTIASGGIVGTFYLENLVRYLEDLSLGTFFMPVAAFWILACGMMSKVNRKLVLACGLGVVTIFLGMPSVAGLHKFLYDHIYFFRMFRNLQYFLWISASILLVVPVFQLKEFLAVPDERSSVKRLVLALWILCLLCLGLVFFYVIGGVDAVTYCAVILCTTAFLTLCVLKGDLAKAVFSVLFLAAILVQSLFVFGKFYKTSYSKNPDILKAAGPTRFSFLRPRQEDEKNFYGKEFAAYSDTSGFVRKRNTSLRYVGVLRTYQVHQDLAGPHLSEYVRHKFYLYNGVRLLKAGEKPVKVFEDLLKSRAAVALVEDAAAVKEGGAPGRSGVRILGKEEITIERFDRNDITFRVRTGNGGFLVYIDSYFPGWRAYVNGQRVPLYRADAAFKGLWIPPGESRVEMRFGSVWLHAFHWMLFCLFNGLGLYVLLGGFARSGFDKRLSREG